MLLRHTFSIANIIQCRLQTSISVAKPSEEMGSGPISLFARFFELPWLLFGNVVTLFVALTTIRTLWF